jgi:hypothetical protein
MIVSRLKQGCCTLKRDEGGSQGHRQCLADSSNISHRIALISDRHVYWFAHDHRQGTFLVDLSAENGTFADMTKHKNVTHIC